MIIKYLSLVLLLTTVSCSSANNEDEENISKVSAKTTVNTNISVTEKANTTTKSVKQKFVHKVEKKHIFSSLTKSDLFQITLTGKNISEGNIDFKVISFNNKNIYQQSFKAIDLIGFGPNPSSTKPLTKKQQDDFIIKRMNEFFAEKNFFKPAIASNMVFDPNYSDKKLWDDIKSDKTATGFKYLLGKEDGRRIAFDKKTGKVVMYFNCC